EKVVILGRNRKKPEAVKPGNRLNGYPPIGATLHHRGGDRVVGTRLVAVARRPPAREQSVDQHARSSAGVAVDHQARRIGDGGGKRVSRSASGEADVIRPVYEALHALPTFQQY